MRRQSIVLIVSGVAVLATAAADLYWWQVQREHALPAYRGLSPIMTGVQP
jgi:hypothetical protein